MELRHLRYFVAVAEELHFNRAADRLNIAQPPLSQQIKHLETELGVELFHRRTKRQVQLTEAGQVLLQATYQILAQLEQAVCDTQRAGRGETGTLTIGFTSSVVYDILPAILFQFRQRFPQVNLVLQELTTTQQEEALQNHRIEVGFCHPPLKDNHLSLEYILQEPLVVALPESHPLATEPAISLHSLADESFILFPRHLGPGLYDQIVSFCEQANFRPNVMQEAIQMQTIIGLISAEMGIALVPASLQSLKRVGVVYKPLESAMPLAEMAPLVETAIVWRPDHTSSVLREFLQVVRRYVNEHRNHPQLF
ncbi:LysR family transcriptional regulator [Leptolyngbya sp. FACHB-17]|uniref:LysR family transcriptional regulator n=1 Tax=unclassified Leptolyngbya TaxID=2650499 RepID=UPI001680739B|nr:LysR family transcriptional regulator [Leptolyngbya sp. FACHB-17]MBD2080006.1 LysR family transcriptional regulator [Leptolyngbya sp. FACHB-17]